jgi:hypothetical protein
MVTGRLLADLRTVFPELELLDAIVVENGAILYDTSSHEVRERRLRRPNLSKPCGQRTLVRSISAPRARNFALRMVLYEPVCCAMATIPFR